MQQISQRLRRVRGEYDARSTEALRIVAIDQHTFIEAHQEFAGSYQGVERVGVSFHWDMVRQDDFFECILDFAPTPILSQNSEYASHSDHLL